MIDQLPYRFQHIGDGIDAGSSFWPAVEQAVGTKVGARKVSEKKMKLALWVAVALPLPSAVETVKPTNPVPHKIAKPMTANGFELRAVSCKESRPARTLACYSRFLIQVLR